ncbi:unnamed protein product, partial [Prorocentrum cordatum]
MAASSSMVPPKGLPWTTRAKQLQLQADEIAKLKKQLQQATSRPPADTDQAAMDLDEASGQDEPSYIEMATKFKSELAELKRRTVEAKPLNKRIEDANREVRRLQTVQSKHAKKVEELKRAAEKAQEALGEAQARAAKLDGELTSAQQSLSELTVRIPGVNAAPPVGPAPGPDEFVPGLTAVMASLGTYLSAKGLPGELSDEIIQNFRVAEVKANEAVQKAAEEAEFRAQQLREQAAPEVGATPPGGTQPEQQPGVPARADLSAEQLRQFLESNSQSVPAEADEEQLRSLAKRTYDAIQNFAASVSKKARTDVRTLDSSGVAVLVPSNVMVSAPPLAAEPTLVPGRAVAGHVHAGLAKGYVAVSLYLWCAEGLSDENRAILHEVMGYLVRLNAIGMPWVLGGDWNLEPSVLTELHEFRAAQGLVYATTQPTCTAAWPGVVYDYFLVSVTMGLRAEQASRADPNVQQPMTRAEVDNAVSTGPHVPVSLGFHGKPRTLWVRQISEPRKLREPPPSGCARFPLDWGRAQAVIQAATDKTGLGQAWDLVLEGLHIELLGRLDRLDETKGTPISGPIGMRWGHFQPQGTNKKIGDRRDGASHAWAVAARWARHIGNMSYYHDHLCEVLKDPAKRHGSPSEEQLCAKMGKSLYDLIGFFSRIQKNSAVLQLLDQRARELFHAGLLRMAEPDLNEEVEYVTRRAEELRAKAAAAQERSWRHWVEQALTGGAGLAHRLLRPRELQEVLQSSEGGQPYKYADDCMQQWGQIWSTHNGRQLDPPSDVQWDPLPALTAADIRHAVGAFPWRTGVGQVPVAPRLLEQASDETNMEAEIADLGEHAVTVLFDLLKLYELVRHDVLCDCCQALGYPMRTAWMLVGSYQQPRTIRAYGSLSAMVTASQGMLAGCSHATTLARVLLTKGLNVSIARSPLVRPRALIDDVSFQWVGTDLSTLGQLWTTVRTFCLELQPLGCLVQPAKCGFVATTREAKRKFAEHVKVIRFRGKAHMRNLGHELHGRAVKKLVHRRRMVNIGGKWSKIDQLRKAVGSRKAGVLWETGDLPAAAHGTSVAGCEDQSLRQLRATAGRFAGYKGHGSLTTYLMTMPARTFDPILEVTMAVVGNFADWVWQARGSPARLCKAFLAMQSKFEVVHLLRQAPSDVLTLLEQGIVRWQERRMLAHYPAHYQGFQVWGRALALGHQGSNGHLYFECEAFQRQQDDEEEEPSPEELLVTRERLRGQAVDTGDGPSYEHLEFALPLAPPLPDQVPEELPEFERGLEGQAWGQQLFVDGSGRRSSFVEARRLGWSVVQISGELLPIKARWGGLPGLAQTVPRSERHAGMRAIQLGRPPVHVLSDQMSFVQEVREWQGRHTRPRAPHAMVWRQIAATVEGRGAPMPTAQWVRAHRELEDAVLADGTAFRYVGNFWADVFAKMGSASIMVSEVHVRACEIQLRDVREAMRYVAWAAERAVRLSVGGSAAVPQQVAKVAQVGMKVPELVAHDLKQLTNGALKCT